MTVERDWFWFWFWFYYALWLASVFTLVLVLRQSSENRSIRHVHVWEKMLQNEHETMHRAVTKECGVTMSMTPAYVHTKQDKKQNQN